MVLGTRLRTGTLRGKRLVFVYSHSRVSHYLDLSVPVTSLHFAQIIDTLIQAYQETMECSKAESGGIKKEMSREHREWTLNPRFFTRTNLPNGAHGSPLRARRNSANICAVIAIGTDFDGET